MDFDDLSEDIENLYEKKDNNYYKSYKIGSKFAMYGGLTAVGLGYFFKSKELAMFGYTFMLLGLGADVGIHASNSRFIPKNRFKRKSKLEKKAKIKE